MKILHLACLNNDPEIQPNMDPKCNPVGGEPHIYNYNSNLSQKVTFLATNIYTKYKKKFCYPVVQKNPSNNRQVKC